MKNYLNDWKTMLLLSATLGLAPFFPEPHILGKLRWITGGTIGMQPIDWFDTVWHGLPWLLLMRIALLGIIKRVRSTTDSQAKD